MKKIGFILILICPLTLLAQETTKEVRKLLNNGKYRQWKVIGTISHLGVKSCKEGSQYFTFYQDTLVVNKCVDIGWVVSEEPYTISQENDETIITIDKIPYHFKKLTKEAPVCDGNENCIRLSYYAKKSDEYTQDIYLTY